MIQEVEDEFPVPTPHTIPRLFGRVVTTGPQNAQGLAYPETDLNELFHEDNLKKHRMLQGRWKSAGSQQNCEVHFANVPIEIYLERVYLVLRSYICPTWTDAQCTAVAPVIIRKLLSSDVAYRLPFTTSLDWPGLKALVISCAHSTDEFDNCSYEFARYFHRYSPHTENSTTLGQALHLLAYDILFCPAGIPVGCLIRAVESVVKRYRVTEHLGFIPALHKHCEEISHEARDIPSLVTNKAFFDYLQSAGSLLGSEIHNVPKTVKRHKLTPIASLNKRFSPNQQMRTSEGTKEEPHEEFIDADLEVIRILIEQASPDVLEQCGLTGQDTQRVFLAALKRMADEYKYRKVHIFDIHDYEKSPELFIEWAKSLVKINEESGFLGNQPEEYFLALNRHIQLLFAPTTLRDVVKWVDLTDEASVLEFCKTVTVWIDQEDKRPDKIGGEENLDETDRVRVHTFGNASSGLCRVCSVFTSDNISHPKTVCPLRKIPDYDNFWKYYSDGKMVSMVQELRLQC